MRSKTKSAIYKNIALIVYGATAMPLLELMAAVAVCLMIGDIYGYIKW